MSEEVSSIKIFAGNYIGVDNTTDTPWSILLVKQQSNKKDKKYSPFLVLFKYIYRSRK